MNIIPCLWPLLDRVLAPWGELGRDDVNWMKHTFWFKTGNKLEYKPVKLQPLTVESFQPKARVY